MITIFLQIALDNFYDDNSLGNAWVLRSFSGMYI